MQEVISVKGARHNNLKNVDFELPLNKFTVVTGVSGSGKSSLAFETLYAEGQRRYTETFSPYTRQFLDRLDKPEVDHISGIPPAIAIGQTNAIRTSRSTVGTMTEISEHLKLLFPRMAKLYSPTTGDEIKPWTADEIHDHLYKKYKDETLTLTFPVSFPKKTTWKEICDFVTAQGYRRVWIDREAIKLEGKTPPALTKLKKQSCDEFSLQLIQDRTTLTKANSPRISEGLLKALELGKGVVYAQVASKQETFTTRYHDPVDNVDYAAPTPSLFSFNSPVGACPDCKGFGRVITIDYELALPDRSLAVEDGVVKPFQTEANAECQEDLERACKAKKINTRIAFDKLPKAHQRFIIEGDPKAKDAKGNWISGKWYGVKGFFDWLESRTYKMHVRVLLARYRAYRECPTCKGSRFRDHIHLWKLNQEDGKTGLTLAEINETPLKDLSPFFDKVHCKDESDEILLEQLRSRLRYLNQVGLGYLTLNRTSRTLSGGEVQRVNLTTCLGSSLVGTLFVLDEPSIGLHSRDVHALIGVLRSLQKRGNTVVVVEHDENMMRHADHLLELGPRSGAYGGELTFEGNLEKLLKDKKSLTGQYLAGSKFISIPEQRRPIHQGKKKQTDFLEFHEITKNNLDELSIDLPLRRLVGITGVSGSGKSTLAYEGIFKGISTELRRAVEEPARIKAIKGITLIDDVILVDQTPLTKTPRSTPLLYLGVYDAVRELYAMSEDAMSAGLNAPYFSFNSGNGRCERCQGTGYEKIEMQFLSDIFVRCPACEGKRFKKFVLQVRYRGLNIHELLETPVDQAIEFFRKEVEPEHNKEERLRNKIADGLELLAQVGLGYLSLGQPLNQLSGGESQRLKLITHIREAASATQDGKTRLFILDEPTTGLHFDDIRVLTGVLQKMVDLGHSVVVIEHNLDVIKSVDWVLDLGPEAGVDGGQLIGSGTPEEIAANPKSHTGAYLKPLLWETSTDELPPAPWKLSEKEQTKSEKLLADASQIQIHGARHHNLKNINVNIPLQKMVVLTGLSGSGKSSLAFDLLFSEGQRRYLDCLNTYARNFIEQLERPDVDSITGIPPTVAIEQRTTSGGAKSTVATVTEIYHFLRLLYARLGQQHDPDTGEVAIQQSADEIEARLRKQLKDGELSLLAPLVKGRKGVYKEIAAWAQRKGFPYLRVDGKWIEPEKFKALDRYKEHDIDLVVGNIDSKSKQLSVLIQQALAYGKGTLYAVDNHSRESIYSTQLYCPGTGRSFEELDPRLFSFNSPHGWCEECQGYGTVLAVKADGDTEAEREMSLELAREGMEDTEKEVCPACNGARLNEVARAVTFKGKSITEINAMTVKELEAFMKKVKLKGRAAQIARDILPEIRQRLHFLNQVGLGYLTMDRSAPTLSGGEAQRIRLAAQLGSNLQGVLYVLDEPTIGLHPRDNEELLGMLRELHNRGNSLIIVEHDEDTMRQADHVIDLGPGAGRHGGTIMAEGSWDEISTNTQSITKLLVGEPFIHPERGERRKIPQRSHPSLKIEGADANNLKDIKIDLPLRRLVCLSGVSGSGKSTLMREVLEPAAKGFLKRGKNKDVPKGPWKTLECDEKFDKVIEVDQMPIGKTSRSSVATYTGLMDLLRQLFASTNEAKMRGLTPAHFSYNSGDGRCPACSGQGTIKVEMNFLPPVYVPCEQCHGKRYTDLVLGIKWKDKSIADILEMQVGDALELFESQPRIHTILEALHECGLDYLALGQTSPTLSGGEAQRLKLVTELSAARISERHSRMKNPQARNIHHLYLLEEPTVGLHLADVKRLIDIMHKLVDAGHSVVVIEHHLDVIAEADYLMDIGPEAGVAGGQVVAQGTPEQVAKSKKSHTGRFLKTLLPSG